MQRRRTTWTFGGIGLICSGLLSAASGFTAGDQGITNGIGLVASLFWCAAVLLLTWGLDRGSSVVARQTMGMVTMTVVAIWPLFESVALGAVITADTSTAWVYLPLAVAFASALIATVTIARAGTVPAPWKWAPLWLLAARAVIFVIPQLFTLASPDGLVQASMLFTAIGGVVSLLCTVGLGSLAIYLAARTEIRTTQTLSSSPDRS